MALILENMATRQIVQRRAMEILMRYVADFGPTAFIIAAFRLQRLLLQSYYVRLLLRLLVQKKATQAIRLIQLLLLLLFQLVCL